MLNYLYMDISLNPLCGGHVRETVERDLNGGAAWKHCNPRDTRGGSFIVKQICLQANAKDLQIKTLSERR